LKKSSAHRSDNYEKRLKKDLSRVTM